MKTNINLLSIQNEAPKLAHEKLVKRLRVLGGLLLVFVVISSLTLFIIKNQLAGDYKTKEQTALSQMNTLHTKEVQYLLLSDRLQGIKKILASRPNLENIISRINTVIPSGVHLDAFQIAEKKLTLTLSSASLEGLDTFLNSATTMATKKDVFSTLSIDTLTGGGGHYILTVEATLL